MHPVDHRTGAEEQQRLEEGVGEQVEHGGLIGPNAGGKEHIAQLRTGRIGDDALDIILREADRSGEDGRDGADIGDNHLGDRRIFEQGRQQTHHIDTSGDHGGGVD